MGIKGSKALQNTQNSRTQAQIRAQKVDCALKTYPFEDISPDLHVKINPRAKRLALRMDPKNRVVNLVIPKRATIRNAYKFALEHKYWIRKKLEELPQPIHFTDGTIFPLLGQYTTIKITYGNTLKYTNIQLKNNELLVVTNKEDPTPRIKRFLMDLAEERLSALAHKKAKTLGKEIKMVDVKDTSSRWGSCSYDGKLSFSWRLIFATPEAFDYVVAHEVSHLCVMDHSPAFWHQCEDLCENYSNGKSWMRRHGDELIRYN